jgi:hypothetical protein
MSYTAPFPISSFLDVDGKPLENGYVWIGVAGSDPVANPISVYWDDAATQLAIQPIRTIGGYPSNAGVRSRLYISATDYSVKVTNVNGAETVPVSLYNATEVYAADVNFLQAGTGAVVRTVQAKLRETVSVLDFGAVGDGVADDTAAIQAAISASANKQLTMPSGTYLINGATGLQISNPIHWLFEANAKLLFNNNNATYIQTAANNVTIENIWIDGGSTSWTRTSNAAIRVKDNGATTSNIKIIRPFIENVAGAGILVGWTNTIKNVTLECPVVQYTKADGVSIAYDVENVTITNPKCYYTGDDSISIVSYSSAANAIKKVLVTDALSSNSSERGFTILGGEDIKISGKVVSSAKQGVLVLQDAGTYNTTSPTRVHVDVQVYNSTGNGMEIGRNATDISGSISVIGAQGARGVLIASGAATEPKRISLSSVLVSSNAGIGLEINNAQQVSIGTVNASSNGTYGVILAAGAKNISCGSIMAHNNNTTSAVGVDNILCQSAVGFSFGSVWSIDDNASPKIERTLDVTSSTNGLIGAFVGVKNTTITAPNIQSSCTNVVTMGGFGVGQFGCVGTVSAKPTATHYPIGTWVLDTTNNKIYFYVGSGTWKETAIT